MNLCGKTYVGLCRVGVMLLEISGSQTLRIKGKVALETRENLAMIVRSTFYVRHSKIF